MENNQRVELKKQFDENYNRLNAEQKKAVDSIEGPVMVIAGPGTGKTQILAMRIANILSKIDVRANNILCLTFTDEGVSEMKNRLQNLIGSESRGIDILTFHSFCNKVIKENENYFGDDDFEVLDELESINIFKRLIEDLPQENLLKKDKDLYFSTKKIKEAFNFIQKENISVEEFIKQADDYIASLPANEKFQYKKKYKEFVAGDPNPSKIEAEEQRILLSKLAVLEFYNYKKNLKDAQRYTFNDLIEKVSACFKEENYVLARYQEQYQYVLIDEFQDSNGSQIDIINNLFSYWGNPNFFVVGDEDQCIYRFQGAEFTNLKNFATKYQENLTTIILKENYRSTQNILDAAANLISNNTERYGDKILQSNSNKQNVLPQVLCFENPMQEFCGVVNKIKELNQKGINYNQIALLYPTNDIGDAVATYLQAEKIPYNLSKEIDILQDPLILDIIQILRYINSEFSKPLENDIFLFKILHSVFLDYTPLEIAKDLFEFNKKGSMFNFSFRSYLLQNENLKWKYDVVGKMENFIKQSQEISIHDLCINILHELNIIQWVVQQKETTWYLEKINTFLNFINQMNTKYNYKLNDFLQAYVDAHIEDKIKVPVYRQITHKDGVHLKTFHASKGREFEVVFLLHANAEKWEKRNNKTYFVIPPTISHTENKDDDALRKEEIRRLFYVGMTRAKSQLYITHHQKNSKEKETQQTVFLNEIADASTEKKLIEFGDLIQIPEEKLIGAYINIFKKDNIQEPLKTKIIDENLVAEKLKNFSLGTSKLNSFLACPLTFYFNYILGVPGKSNPNMEFGNIIHSLLESVYKEVTPDKQFMTLQEIEDIFSQKMKKYKFISTEYDFTQRLEYGKKLLKKYYEEILLSSNKNVVVEKLYRIEYKENIFLSGKIDKIELDKNRNATIVDYKTGKYSKKDFDAPDENNIYGGQSWRQAVWYKMLYETEALKQNIVINNIRYEFLSYDKGAYDEKIKIENLYPNADAVHKLRKIIDDSWNKISNFDFSIPQDHDSTNCEWCQFVNNLEKKHYNKEENEVNTIT